MPAEKLVRARMPVNELLARSFAIIMLNVFGGTINGVAFAIAMVIGEEIRLVAADAESSSFSSMAVQAGAIGGVLGAIVGAVSSPISVIAMIRTECIWPLTVTFLVSSLAALAAVIHPVVGLIGSLVAYLASCVIASLRAPQTWPVPIPPSSCVRCGYNLKGLAADVCPECGNQRSAPRQCRVCLNPYPPIDLENRSLIARQVICDSCHQHLGPDMNCQRCGERLSYDRPDCSGCHRPIGLPSKN